MLERDCEIRNLMDVHEIKMVLTTYSVASPDVVGRKIAYLYLSSKGMVWHESFIDCGCL